MSTGRRRAAIPPVRYPPSLPITARVDDLAAAIRDHQVVVVAGETGSGKTTQLPKVCLELGRGVQGMIGHTQPRRIAARTVAERIAAELGVRLGGPVGYEYRFDRRVGDDTLISVMTDGILLAGIQADPELAAYDTLIIDEAHERSLNIDFLVGYVTRLLPRRPDLKVIVTSATIDPGRFSRHFGDAPVVEVSGRTYPVEVRYRPLDGDRTGAEQLDQVDAIAAAVTELDAERPGDILVFLSGEREIRDTTDALSDLGLPDTEILPLYARLPPARQRAVFEPHDGRRIVLATNVAETSLTVPGIRYVIDAGYARISRYSSRLKVQRLPIERISQASADQRAGRCGRTADGICIRLYSEDDYAARPRFTEPEILRTNLASVLLQMAALGLGDIDDFGFLDPPDRRQVRDGLALLHELGAVTADAVPGRRSAGAAAPALTPVGRTLARLPVDPRMGRMLVEADRNGCLDEVLVITAALSIPDPRLWPDDTRQTADAQHARFADERSDFMTWLHLWRYLRERRAELSSNQFRKLCRAEHLHYLRVREWQDLYAQLRRVARSLGMRRTPASAAADPAAPDAVHRSLLAGLLSHIGVREGTGNTYRGARGAAFAIQPGSVLFKRSPRWIVAAELVETSRLWARTVARIRPQWVEQLAGHLVIRRHSDPWWDADRGQAMAHERVSLYGLPLVTARPVPYAAVDPAVARDLFIRNALVEGRWRGHHEFWRVNEQRIAQARELEDKLRRRDVVADDDAIHDFYDARVAADVTSMRRFDGWWKRTRRHRPQLLELPWDVLLADGVPAGGDQFPDHWRCGDVVLPLRYRFDPGAADDGVTVDVPLAVLNTVDPAAFEWLVPGLRPELVTELLRTLPKDVRRRVGPVPDTARDVLERLGPAGGSLRAALVRAVKEVRGVDVHPDDLRSGDLPTHLRIRFRITDDGRLIDAGDDLAELQRRLAPRVRARLTDAAGVERGGATSWTFGELPRTVVVDQDGHAVTGFPALVDEGDSVAVRALAGRDEQRLAMWTGTRRLLLLAVGSPVARVHRRLDTATKLALATNPHGGVAALIDDAITATADELLRRHGGPVWTADRFATLQALVRADLDDVLLDVLTTVAGILTAAAGIRERLVATAARPGTRAAADDMTAQLAGLVHAGFVTAKSVRRLDDVARYLRALGRRLETVPREPDRDRLRMEEIAVVSSAYREQLDRLPQERRTARDVLEIPWMIEELRVALFAQSVGTAHRVSPERVRRAIDDLRR